MSTIYKKNCTVGLPKPTEPSLMLLVHPAAIRLRLLIGKCSFQRLKKKKLQLRDPDVTDQALSAFRRL